MKVHFLAAASLILAAIPGALSAGARILPHLKTSSFAAPGGSPPLEPEGPAPEPEDAGTAPAIDGFTFRGRDFCRDSQGQYFRNWEGIDGSAEQSVENCAKECEEMHSSNGMFSGIEYYYGEDFGPYCNCMLEPWDTSGGEITQIEEGYDYEDFEGYCCSYNKAGSPKSSKSPNPPTSIQAKKHHLRISSL